MINWLTDATNYDDDELRDQQFTQQVRNAGERWERHGMAAQAARSVGDRELVLVRWGTCPECGTRGGRGHPQSCSFYRPMQRVDLTRIDGGGHGSFGFRPE